MTKHNKKIPWKTVWIKRYHGKINQIEDIVEQKPDYSNDYVLVRPTIQRVRIWFEPLGKERPAKVLRTL